MLRFIDSCAHYNNSTIGRKWTNVQATWSSSGGRRNAPYITSLTTLKTLTYTPTWFLGAACRTALNSGLLATQANGTPMAGLVLNPDSTLSVFINNNSIFTTSLAVQDRDIFHYYEVMYAFSGGGTASVTLTGSLWVDSDLWGTFSGVGNLGGLPTNGANQVGIVTASNVDVMDFYAVDTSTLDINGFSSTLTSRLGDVEIDAIFPDADVTTNWGTFGGDGTHAYTCVNETAPDDDTSYVLSTTTGSSETFNYQPISGFTGSILGAQYLVCARKDAEGSREIAMTVGTGSVNTSNFLAIPQYLADYYVYYIAPLDSNNGTAWTTANINSQNFGVTLIG